MIGAQWTKAARAQPAKGVIVLGYFNESGLYSLCARYGSDMYQVFLREGKAWSEVSPIPVALTSWALLEKVPSDKWNKPDAK